GAAPVRLQQRRGADPAAARRPRLRGLQRAGRPRAPTSHHPCGSELNRVVAQLRCHRVSLISCVSSEPFAHRTDHMHAGWFLGCCERLRAERVSLPHPSALDRDLAELWAFIRLTSHFGFCTEPHHPLHREPITVAG
ncbi:GLRX5 isoform 1, partial [Pan troglodytes]